MIYTTETLPILIKLFAKLPNPMLIGTIQQAANGAKLINVAKYNRNCRIYCAALAAIQIAAAPVGLYLGKKMQKEIEGMYEEESH